MFYWEESTPHIERLLRLAFKMDKTKDFLRGYDDIEDIIEYVKESCWLGYWDDRGLVHGFILLEWISERTASLHVCTFTNNFDWVKCWDDVIEDEVSEHCDQLHAMVPYDKRGVMALCKRIGFTFKKVSSYYKGLKDL